MWQVIFNEWVMVGCDFLGWSDYTQEIMIMMSYTPNDRWLLQKRWQAFNMCKIGEYLPK